MNLPISIKVENARLALNAAFNQIIAETNLPAFLYESIILSLLSEVRDRKNLELVSEMNALLKEQDDSNEKQD